MFSRTDLRLLAVAAMLCTVAIPVNSSYAQNFELRQPSGVVELFTSQGCSSCPPADLVLKELSQDPETLALTWHVDYWDYLGWKDTFSSPISTRRQQQYARSLGKRGVYTPQAIINGHTDVVGSRGKAVVEALRKHAGTPQGIAVPIDAKVSGSMLKIRIDARPEARDATLWMVYFDDKRDVVIERGENAGRKLTYTNIVREFEMIGMIHDQPLQTEFPLREVGRRGYDSCALLLQRTTAEGNPGAIIGAAVIQDIR